MKRLLKRFLFLLPFLVASCLPMPVHAQSAGLLPEPKAQFFDSNGNPLNAGKVYTYAAGTTTPLASYTSSTAGVSNSNPVILDSAGRANIWLGSSSYKIVLKTSADVTIWTVDNVNAGGVIGNPWTKTGTNIYPTSVTNSVSIGRSTQVNAAALSVDGVIIPQATALQGGDGGATLYSFAYMGSQFAYNSGGLAGVVWADTAGTYTGTLVGGKFVAYTLDHNAGAVPSATVVNTTSGGFIGVYGRTTAYASGTVPTAASVMGQGMLNIGPAVVTNSFSLQATAGANTGAGSITNAVGLRIESITYATNNWAIQSAGGQSYHVGNLRIGSTTAPTVALDVTGGANISGSVAVGSASAPSVRLHITDTTAESVRVQTSNATAAIELYSGNTDRGGFFATSSFIGMAFTAGGGLTVSTTTTSFSGAGGSIGAFSSTSTSSSTNLTLLYNGSIVPVLVGAADSCTAGFRCLRIAN